MTSKWTTILQKAHDDHREISVILDNGEMVKGIIELRPGTYDLIVAIVAGYRPSTAQYIALDTIRIVKMVVVS